MSFSPIACEVCRTKKRKCDRKIPTCSQCTRSSLACTYPGTSKRGLPSGYIAKIEERLAHTEAALLQALSIIHAPDAGSIRNVLPGGTSLETAEGQQLEFNEIRIAKVEEWQTYPLDSEQHQKDWMMHKIRTDDLQDGAREPADQANEPSSLRDHSHQPPVSSVKRQRTTIPEQEQPDTTVSPAAPNGTEATETTKTWPASTYRANYYDSQLDSSVPDTRAQQAAPIHPIIDVREKQQDELTLSKARRLSTLHSRKYF